MKAFESDRAMVHGRRAVIGFVALSAIGLATGHAQTAPTVTCHDPAKLPLSQKSRRRALGYVDAAPEPAKQCGGCAFFSAGTSGCGSCQLLTGGPVSAIGVCNSFAAKGK